MRDFRCNFHLLGAGLTLGAKPLFLFVYHHAVLILYVYTQLKALKIMPLFGVVFRYPSSWFPLVFLKLYMVHTKQLLSNDTHVIA